MKPRFGASHHSAIIPSEPQTITAYATGMTKDGFCIGTSSTNPVCDKKCPSKASLECAKNECMALTGTCCRYECTPIKKEDPNDKHDAYVPEDGTEDGGSHGRPAFCRVSPQQLCKKKCPDVACPDGKCLMRNDNCCDLICTTEKKAKKIAKRNARDFCPDSAEQTCKKTCPSVKSFKCKRSQCLMRQDSCCDLHCVDKGVRA